ncbi:MAG: DsbA family protein [Microcoleaceae cyanobacterium]
MKPLLSGFSWQQRWQEFLKTVAAFMLCIVLVSCSQSTSSADFEQKVIQVIRENPEVVLESVQVYQQQQQDTLNQARETFLQQMRENPAAIIGDSPTQGAADQQIVLVEFSDFQCPFCSRAHETIQQFMGKHQDTVTLVYKHFPLAEIHPEAIPAARASWAAQQQGKFWEYQDALFKQQDQLGEDLYVSIAEKLELELDKFNADRQGEAANRAVEQDTQLARGLGIRGTPFFVMNGETFSGAVELSQMEDVLKRVQQ